MSKTAIIIPARFNSSRFPGKSLQLIDEYNVIQTVYFRAKKVKSVDRVIVATDDERIMKSITDVGGHACMTHKDHQNGTSRIAEVAEGLDEYKWVVNLQGDEPFVEADDIELLINRLKEDNIQIASLMKECDSEEIIDPNCVKVKTDQTGVAIQFSRRPLHNEVHKNFKHIGIYGFQRDVLLQLVKLKPTASEISEKLEQLRWLENGYFIQMVETKNESIGIDVPEDLMRARAMNKSFI